MAISAHPRPFLTSDEQNYDMDPPHKIRTPPRSEDLFVADHFVPYEGTSNYITQITILECQRKSLSHITMCKSRCVL